MDRLGDRRDGGHREEGHSDRHAGGPCYVQVSQESALAALRAAHPVQLWRGETPGNRPAPDSVRMATETRADQMS